MVLKIGLNRLIRRPIDHYSDLVQCFELSRLWTGTKLPELLVRSVNRLNRLVPPKLNCSTSFFFHQNDVIFFAPNFQYPHPTPPTSNGCFPLLFSTYNTPKSMLLANGDADAADNPLPHELQSFKFLFLIFNILFFIALLHIFNIH